MLQLLGTIIPGAITGGLARVVLPSRQAYGWVVPILIGSSAHTAALTRRSRTRA